MIATAIRWFFWILGAGAVFLLMGVLRLLPLRVAARFCGLLAATIGPMTPWHRRNVFNIGYAMPETSMAERRKISRMAFSNFGFVAGEYLHLKKLIASERVTIEGMELLEAHKGGGFFISAHLGNWEIAIAPLVRLNKKSSAISRPINNPLLRRMWARRYSVYTRVFGKGASGARGIAETVARDEYVAMLVDQKLREGMMLNFFGHKASTAVTHIKIALRNDVPIFLSQVIRKPDSHFVIKVSKLDLPEIKGKPSDAQVAKVGTEINAIIEGWIRENPGQWLWTHRRWPASKGEVFED